MAEKDHAYTKEPMLSKVIIGGTSYYLKDAEAREVIDSILNDYLKASDKTELDGKISANTTAIGAEETRAEAAEKTLQDNIDSANREIAKKQDALAFAGTDAYDKDSNKVATEKYVAAQIGSVAHLKIEVLTGSREDVTDPKSDVIYLEPKGEGKTGYRE